MLYSWKCEMCLICVSESLPPQVSFITAVTNAMISDWYSVIIRAIDILQII